MRQIDYRRLGSGGPHADDEPVVAGQLEFDRSKDGTGVTFLAVLAEVTHDHGAVVVDVGFPNLTTEAFGLRKKARNARVG